MRRRGRQARLDPGGRVGVGNGIHTRPAIQHVVAGSRVDEVVQPVAGAIGSAGGEQAQVLDIGPEAVGAEVAVDRIAATAGQDRIGFADPIAGAVHIVGIGTVATDQGVVAR
ncbi:hypothetical protein D9M68_478490 [compost metagenome]